MTVEIKSMGKAARLGAWLALSRLPFHIVGSLPFLLGMSIARAHGISLRWPVGAWGVVGVELIMLATYYAGEYWDQAEDAISGHLGGSRFAGGSQVPQRNLVAQQAPLIASRACVGLALAVGLLLQFRYHTGPLTLPLGILGLVGGFFYSTRPVRWVSTGWGEAWIGVCYGWLPIASAYYLQSGHLHSTITAVAWPVALTIFNVILLNEFPDYPADSSTGKRNLAVRLGLRRAACVYCAAAIAAWPLVWISIWYGAPAVVRVLYLPSGLLSLVLVVLVGRGSWRDRRTLEWLCGINIAVNVGTTAAYLIAFLR